MRALEGWNRIRFGDFAVVNPKVKLKNDVLYPYISMDQIDTSNKFVRPNELRHKGSGAKFKDGDTLFARITPCLQNGKIAQAKGVGGVGFGSTEYFVFRGNDSVSDNEFVYYLAKSEIIRKSAENSMTGATGRQRADAQFLKNVELTVPPLPTQKKIAAILSAYDDLIENNLRRIALLEEQARLVYEEWFVVQGLPEGWKTTHLGSLISHDIGGGWGKEVPEEKFEQPAFVIRGTDIESVELGNIENVPLRYHSKSNLRSRRLRHGDIVFEVSGGSTYVGVAKSLLITNELLGMFKEDVMCASFCKQLRPISTALSYFLIQLLKYLRTTKGTEIFEKRSASNIVNYNWVAFLKYQKVKVPDDNSLTQYNNVVRPIYAQITNLGKQNVLLREARDLLLPRLMAGVIEV